MLLSDGGAVYPEWWGTPGDGTSEDSAYFAKAMSCLSASGGGEIRIGEKTYVIENVEIPSYVTVRGYGWKSILKQKSVALGRNYCLAVNQGTGGTADPADNKREIAIRDIQLLGTVATDSFEEFTHLLNLNAVSNVLVERVKFTGFRGDGVYLGSSNTGALERHNVDVTIRDCFFDGVNRDNRNGISVIDGTGIKILNNTFLNCTRSNMPGPIDIEPDADAYARIRDILIQGNTFRECYGSISGGNINVYLPLPQASMTTPSRDIRILDNDIDGFSADGLSNGIVVAQLQVAADSDAPNNILIAGNTVRRTRRAFQAYGVKDLKYARNVFYDCTVDPTLGIKVSASTKYRLMDVSFVQNTFSHLSSLTIGAGIEIYDVSRLSFLGNNFDNNGLATGLSGSHMIFDATGTTERVLIALNTFQGARATKAIAFSGSHTTALAHNLVFANNFLNSSNVELLYQQSISDNLATFGGTLPVYMQGNSPYIGLNSYFSAGDKYGLGSAASYAAAFTYAPSTGTLTFKYTAATGNEHAAATMTDGFTISRFGTLHLGPNSTDPQIVLGTDAVRIRSLSGTPEGTVSTAPGSLFLDRAGSGAATPYWKHNGSGSSGYRRIGTNHHLSLIITGISLNSAATDVATFAFLPGKYRIRKITAFDASINLAASVATFDIRTAAAGAGTAVVAAQTVTALSASSKFQDATLAAFVADYCTITSLIVRNVTAHGSAATISLMLDVDILS